MADATAFEGLPHVVHIVVALDRVMVCNTVHPNTAAPWWWKMA